MLFVQQFSCLAGGVLAVENPLGKRSYAGDSWFFAGTGGLSAQFKRGQVKYSENTSEAVVESDTGQI